MSSRKDRRWGYLRVHEIECALRVQPQSSSTSIAATLFGLCEHTVSLLCFGILICWIYVSCCVKIYRWRVQFCHHLLLKMMQLLLKLYDHLFYSSMWKYFNSTCNMRLNYLNFKQYWFLCTLYANYSKACFLYSTHHTQTNLKTSEDPLRNTFFLVCLRVSSRIPEDPEGQKCYFLFFLYQYYYIKVFRVFIEIANIHALKSNHGWRPLQSHLQISNTHLHGLQERQCSYSFFPTFNKYELYKNIFFLVIT